MTITFTITAESGEDLRRQLLDLLVERHAVSVLANIVPEAQRAAAADLYDTLAEPVEPKHEPEAAAKPVMSVEQLRGPKRRAHRRVRPAAPVATPEPVEEETEEQLRGHEEPVFGPEVEPEPADVGNGPADLDAISAGMTAAVENEKLKAVVISRLQDMFTEGKVKTIRYVLDTYGEGAKSFPEIDAARFPLIDQALRRGEGA